MARKTLQLGRPTALPASPGEAVLDRVPNPQTDTNYAARLAFPEFTSICPVTGQPDFGTMMVDDVPRRWLSQSQSLKLYLNSFRNHGAFHEDCTVEIGKRVVKLLGPKWLRIGGYFYPRGGMPIDVFWQHGRQPKDVWVPDQGVPPYRARGESGARETGDVEPRPASVADEEEERVHRHRGAARRGRQLGCLHLDRGVQRVEPDTEQNEGRELDRPCQVERHDRERERRDGAAADHQLFGAPARDEERHQQRIDDAASGEARDHEARDRRTRLARGDQQQGNERKKSEHHDAFDEHGAETNLGARIGKNLAVARGETRE